MSADRAPLSVAVKIGAAFFNVGLAGWIWTGEWRWAVMGVLVLFLSAVAAAPGRTVP